MKKNLIRLIYKKILSRRKYRRKNPIVKGNNESTYKESDISNPNIGKSQKIYIKI